jgi:DUF971 family protein
MPIEIEKLGAVEIKITWDDGHESVYRNPELRFACSCALCVEETTGVRRLRREQVPEEILPTGMELVGNYAVQIFFNDTATTEIYTYDHLRQLCPCDDCRRVRGVP